ncbi:MAG: DUF3048 domain-containing protein [Actinobacteria bacterium]|nr:DUF3048 domain-containing protein [Actinomycetota bacterium]
MAVTRKGGRYKAATGWRRRREPLLVILPLLLLSATLLPLAGCKATRVGEETVEPPPEPEKPPVNPLTGETVASWDLVTRRPLAVKVENDPKARPQSGIVDADLVFEELVEGGVTRFICIYLSRDSQAIGPTRSARPSDIDIISFLDPLLICSGGSTAVISMVQASGLHYITEDASHFWRERSRRAPHNLYTSTSLLRQYLAENGDSFNKLPDAGLYFAEDGASEEPEGAGGQEEGEDGGEAASQSVMYSPATAISIAYKATICAASYQYDAATRSYLHFIQGAPHTDATTGRQVAPRNVIVQYVRVTDSGLRDTTGASVPESHVTGSGKCLVFTDGKAYHATWRKNNRNSPTVYVDENGDPVPLAPGQTWIHLINEEIAVKYQ